MTAPAAFQATFSDFKLVKGRKVAQIVVEVPLELADAALAALGGLPKPDTDRWVAVARLNPPGATDTGAAKGSAAADHPHPHERSASAPGGAKRRFNEMPLPQQVALRCNDAFFQTWVSQQPDFLPGMGGIGGSDTTEWVREKCDVHSRADIKPGSLAEIAWKKLETRFLLDTGRMAEEHA